LFVPSVAPFILRLVPVATPRDGVVKEGDVPSTILPDPVVEFPRTVIVPVVAGIVIVDDPSAPVAGERVMLPDVALANAMVPTVVPATPSVGVAVNAGVEPARTPPAKPVIEISPLVALIESGEVAVDTRVPLAVGSVSVGVPATACAVIVAVPLVAPVNATEPVAEDATPSVNVLEENVRFALS
jgi:hypothetical protein